MRKRSTISLALFAVLAMVLGGAALAWACGPQASVSANPNSGAPGSQFTVSGAGFQPGPVEIRWNSSGGPLLGTATGPGFSISVTVPSGALEKQHYVLGVQQALSPSTAFTVAGTAPSGQNDASATGGETPAGSQTSTVATGVDASSDKPASTGSDRPTAREPVQSTSPSTSGAVVTTSSGQEVFAPSVAGSSAAKSSSGKKAQEPARGEAQTGKAVDEIASSEGLYSGLESPAVLPSPFDGAVGSEGDGNLLTVGVALLATGLIAMFAGVLVAEMRRRRAAETGRRLR